MSQLIFSLLPGRTGDSRELVFRLKPNAPAQRENAAFVDKIDEVLGFSTMATKRFSSRFFSLLVLMALALRWPKDVHAKFNISVDERGTVSLDELQKLASFRGRRSIHQDLRNHFPASSDRGLVVFKNRVIGLDVSRVQIVVIDDETEKALWARIMQELAGTPHVHVKESAAAIGTTGGTPSLDTEHASLGLQDFLREYRLRLSERFARFDFAMFYRSQRARSSSLEQMYVPRRLATELPEPMGIDGEVLEPDKLRAHRQNLLIRGGVGSGKTTWLRWTFRQLLELPTVLPIYVELRRLTALWKHKEPNKIRRDLDTYLWTEVEAWIGARWQYEFHCCLREASPVRPVLLIDGWDEVGDSELAEDLRVKLVGLTKSCPSMLVVVTTRPYGLSQPSRAEQFQVLDLQPLSDIEIHRLANSFYEVVLGSKTDALGSSNVFQDQLKLSTEARVLSRTPLLLLMMLASGPNRPLLRQRHLLFAESLRNLLSDHPDRREEAGVELVNGEWHPKEYEDRLRAAAMLAYALQQGIGHTNARGLFLRPWGEVSRFLPDCWLEREREGFLRWLSGSVGLLSSPMDETVGFQILGFQEYLAAYHLYLTVREQREQDALLLELASNPGWWESLRLWVAIVAERDHETVKRWIALLVSCEGPPFWLAGVVLSDQKELREFSGQWARGIARHLSLSDWQLGYVCAETIGEGSNEQLREAVGSAARDLAPNCTWSTWLWLNRWCGVARVSEGLPLPTDLLGRLAVEMLTVADPAAHHRTARHVALGRIFAGSGPYWPEIPDLTLLRLWPSARMTIG